MGVVLVDLLLLLSLEPIPALVKESTVFFTNPLELAPVRLVIKSPLEMYRMTLNSTV